MEGLRSPSLIHEKKDISAVIEKEDSSNLTVIDTVPFDKNQKIVVLSINKIFDKERYPELNSLCAEWSIKRSDLIDIIKISDFISGHDVQYLYSTLPCEYEGYLKVGLEEFYFNVNAGSYITLMNAKDESIYMGCTNKDCEQYFAMNGGSISDK